MMDLIFLPPGPMRSRILSVGMLSLKRRGAYAEIAARGSLSVASMVSRISRRAFFGFPRGLGIIGMPMPVTLVALWGAGIPGGGPAAFKFLAPLRSLGAV